MLVETMVVAGRRMPHRTFGVDRTYQYHDRRVARALRDVADGLRRGAHLAARGSHGPSRGTASRSRACVESPNTYAPDAYRLAGSRSGTTGSRAPDGAALTRSTRGRVQAGGAGVLPGRRRPRPLPFVEGTLPAPRADPECARSATIRVRSRSLSAPTTAAPERPFTVVFVGSGEPRKGLHLALEAWRTERGRCHRSTIRRLRTHAVGVRSGDRSPSPQSERRGARLYRRRGISPPSIRCARASIRRGRQRPGHLRGPGERLCPPRLGRHRGADGATGSTASNTRRATCLALTSHLVRLATDAALLDRMRGAVIDHRKNLSWAAAASRLEDAYREARRPPE